MKVLIATILFFFYIGICSAKNIYISNGGNDTNNGLTTGTAWATISKLNLSWVSVVANGDSILFRSGDTFTGQINVGKSVKFGSYQTGNKPLITGLVTLTSWVLDGGNVWRTNPPPSQRLKRFCNILTQNGVPQAVGRYPNGTAFLTFQSATTTQLVSSSMAGQNWTNTEVVIRKIAYIAERAIVANQSGTTITYGTTPAIDPDPSTRSSNRNATEGTGFFFQRFRGSLDVQGEWYYTDTTQTMYLYSTVNPNSLTIKASYVDTLVNLGVITNTSFNNLKFEGGNLCVFMSKNGAGINITNCDFVNNTRVVNFHNTGFTNILNNTFDQTFNCGIFIYDTHNKAVTIQNNVFTNSGQLFGMGIFATEGNLRAIYSLTDSLKDASNFQNIIGNRVIKTGSSGIRFNGSNMIVRRNVVDSFCNLLDDGGGIYTFTSGTPTGAVFINRVVDSNFVSNSSGAPNGAGGSQVSLIYLDDLTQNMTLLHNTVWDVSGTIKANGFQTSNPLNVNFRDNTVYNAGFAINVNKKYYSNITNLVIHKNILYQKTNTQYNFRHINTNLTQPTPITITQSLTNLWDMDSNWVSNLKSTGTGYTYYYSADGVSYTFPPDFNLNTWQTTYGHDVHSTLPPVAYTGTNSNLYTNPSDVTLVVNFLGLRKRDPKGVIYDNFAQVPRWSSLILIDDGNAPVTNIPPVADAGVNKVITLPTSSVSVTATATDADGTIAGYTWIKFSGPAGGTITTPNAATTTITGLQAGTYIYQVTATDNLGATGTDQMQILVNPAPNILPTANAGSDQTITLPTSTANLNGSGADADGTIVSYAWVKLVSSPSGGTISNPNIASPSLSGLIQGVYQYQLTVTDNDGGIGKDTVRITVNAAPNIAPTANAGADQTINLPTSSTTVNGSGSTDPDGSIVSYVWVKLSGPAGGTLATPNAVSSTVSSLQAGTYTYRLTVTDNFGLTGTDQMQITVNAAPNQPPVANAGADQTITLPTSSTSVNGSGSSDPDGTISGYAWIKISGPAGGTLATPNSVSSTVSALQAGIYTYRLTVTDNLGLTATDQMQITVNAAPNQPPVANAGTDQTITLPTNSTTLNGTASTDPDGTITAYLWTHISGPSGSSITTPTGSTTGVTSLAQGVHVYSLMVTDNLGLTNSDLVQVTINPAIPPPNQPPVAVAGADQTITLPTNSVSLNGTGSSDPDGTIASFLWSKISGPASGSFSTPNASTTNFTGLTAGVYSVRLKVVDNNGDSATDVLQVTVNPAPNVNPTAIIAGGNQTITLPTNSTSFAGSGTDPDGTITGYLWTQISGPNSAGITTPTAQNTNITGLIQGIYIFQLQVTDNSGGTGTAAIQVTVNAAPNVNPTAIIAGGNQTITLPTNSTTLVGSGTDSDGTITGYLWTQISGPNTAGISAATSSTTGITGMIQGIYVFQLRVTDNDGGTGTTSVQVTVNAAPANIPPTANAGIDQTTQLPRDSVVVVASGNDPDGTIAGYAWTKISGPATFTIVSPTSATTKITGLVVGVYKFVITVTDNLGLTGKDTMQVTVIGANILPTADAGANIIITAPTNSTSFTGSGSDPDGSITGYHWVQLSGPNTSTIVSPNAASTNVNNLIVGDYIFELTVTDNQGGTGTDQIQVTVLAQDILPTANAGPNLAITLPDNDTLLVGSGQDVDGTIASYQWQLVSGPAGSNFGTPNAATTTFNNLTSVSTTVAGVYIVRLTVTDNNGGTGTDTVQVTVNPVPIIPTAVLLRGYKIN